MNPEAIIKQYGLSGKTALVTGGGSGIGHAIAQCLSELGASVVIAGRREAVLENACDRIGNGADYKVLDLSCVESFPRFVTEFKDKHGALDILINNAGNTVKKPFSEGDLHDFNSVFEVHVTGPMELTRNFIQQSVIEQDGSVIFTSSMTAFIGQPYVMPYTVAKTALTGLIRALTAEFAEQGLRVNGVAPGWIDTELYRKAVQHDKERKQKIMSRIPAKKLGQPEDIGWACAFLSSAAASYIHGQVVLVDGGAAAGF